MGWQCPGGWSRCQDLSLPQLPGTAGDATRAATLSKVRAAALEQQELRAATPLSGLE